MITLNYLIQVMLCKATRNYKLHIWKWLQSILLSIYQSTDQPSCFNVILEKINIYNLRKGDKESLDNITMEIAHFFSIINYLE